MEKNHPGRQNLPTSQLQRTSSSHAFHRLIEHVGRPPRLDLFGSQPRVGWTLVEAAGHDQVPHRLADAGDLARRSPCRRHGNCVPSFVIREREGGDLPGLLAGDCAVSAKPPCLCGDHASISLKEKNRGVSLCGVGKTRHEKKRREQCTLFAEDRHLGRFAGLRVSANQAEIRNVQRVGHSGGIRISGCGVSLRSLAPPPPVRQRSRRTPTPDSSMGEALSA